MCSAVLAEAVCACEILQRALVDGCGWCVHDSGCIATATYMGIGYNVPLARCGSRWKAIVYTFSPPTIQSSHVAIAMYLTLCAMLLRCLAMRLAGWGVCDVRWIAGGMCDPELLSTGLGVRQSGWMDGGCHLKRIVGCVGATWVVAFE